MFGGVNASSEMRLAGVAAHHALAVEAGPDLADRFLHHRNPATAVGAIERQDRPFELVVEVLGIVPVALIVVADRPAGHTRSEEHTSELQSLMRISYAVFCLK